MDADLDLQTEGGKDGQWIDTGSFIQVLCKDIYMVVMDVSQQAIQRNQRSLKKIHPP